MSVYGATHSKSHDSHASAVLRQPKAIQHHAEPERPHTGHDLGPSSAIECAVETRLYWREAISEPSLARFAHSSCGGTHAEDHRHDARVVAVRMLRGSGATRLFQVSGITVFMHWSWLLVAVFEISGRTDAYSSLTWNVLEYLALFGSVTLHEFGHALACRSVGGRADEILLWPFGGIAIVDPPPLPGATLWSIAAGPLVNVALIPILGGLALLIPAEASPHIHAFLRSVTFINVGLLLFNLLPIYPLDGGQVLGALLWFVLGRARSMLVTAIIGLVGVVGIGLLTLRSFSLWLGFIGVFVASQCLHSIRLARSLNRMASGPRRTGVACPSCHKAAPIGSHWRCDHCGAAFDVEPRCLMPTGPARSSGGHAGGSMTNVIAVGLLSAGIALSAFGWCGGVDT